MRVPSATRAASMSSAARHGPGSRRLAYALGRRGFEVWADDAVAFKVDGGEIAAIPLPFALRLRRRRRRILRCAPPRWNGRQTARRRRCGIRRSALVRSHRFHCSSEVGPRRSSRLSARESLPAVLYHSFYFSLDESSTVRRMGTQFLELIAEVSVFRVSLRPGLDAMADLLDDLERRVLAPAC